MALVDIVNVHAIQMYGARDSFPIHLYIISAIIIVRHFGPHTCGVD